MKTDGFKQLEKMIYDKTGIDLGYLKDMNSLVRKIKEVKELTSIKQTIEKEEIINEKAASYMFI